MKRWLWIAAVAFMGACAGQDGEEQPQGSTPSLPVVGDTIAGPPVAVKQAHQEAEGNMALPDEGQSSAEYEQATAEPAPEVLRPAEAQCAALIDSLQKGGLIQGFFQDGWTLVYHADNRASGSVDGEQEGMPPAQADVEVALPVLHAGEDWDGNKITPKRYDIAFDLKARLKVWGRLEQADSGGYPADPAIEGQPIYLFGGGASDYLLLYWNSQGRIARLEYRSEDPG